MTPLEICTLIPHAGSMCLLEQVLEWSEDKVLCVTRSHWDPNNPLRDCGRLSAVHAIEYAGQAAAVHGALLARKHGKIMIPALLASVSGIAMEVDRLDQIDGPLEIEARCLMAMDGNSIYAFDVRCETRELVAGRITIMKQRGREG